MSEEREVLLDLSQKVHPEWWEMGTPVQAIREWVQFVAMLDAGAYVDAALMLVPRGWIVAIYRAFDDDGAFHTTVNLTDSFTVGRGRDLEDEVTVTERKGALTTFHDPTALALAAAIARTGDAS